jgi:hypothetical protein
MANTRRPLITATEFKQKVTLEEQALIVTAIEAALKYTFERDGSERCISSFRLMYSGLVFTRIWRFIDEAFSKTEGWRVKRSGFTFILIKDEICQFHLYKGNKSFPFKAETNRQKRIVYGEHYSDLEDLPSVIIRHYSDKLSVNLIGVDALFFENGKQEDSLDIMKNMLYSSPTIKLGSFSITNNSDAERNEEPLKFVAKGNRKKKKTEAKTK